MVQLYLLGGANVLHCPPVRAHRCHLANTMELVLPLAHLSPQPKWQIDRFSHFCRGHGRMSWGTLVPKTITIELANTLELVLPSAHPSSLPKWQIVDQFSRFCTAESPYTLQWASHRPFPKKLPLPMALCALQGRK